MNILWLASWYPNQLNPYEGDFIQRHAKALSIFSKVNIIYVSQTGESFNIEQSASREQQSKDLFEKIVFFDFKKTGIRLLDKVRYNIKYYRTYKTLLKKYIEKNGKPDVIHVHVPVKAGLMAIWAKKKWQIPFILSEQSSWYNNNFRGSFNEKTYIHRQNVKRVFRSADIVTNVSAAVGDILKRLFDLKEVKTIHNTVDTSLFRYVGESFDKFRFIHVSTLTHQKNVEGILNAVKLLSGVRKDFELLIVGPITSMQIELINILEISRFVSYTGEIPYAEVATQMQSSSAFVLFSRHENFPCVVIESLCCGLPCIATNVGGVAEAIDNSNGILVESENELQLSEAMNTMLNEYSKFDRARISKNAQDKYGYSTIGQQFFNLYQEIVRN